MTDREEYVLRVAKKINQHPWYEHTSLERCLEMAEYMVAKWELYEKERSKDRERSS